MQSQGNTQEIYGNIGSVSALRTTNTKQVPVINFTVAVNGQEGQGPTWYEVTLFGPRATKYAESLTKGSFVRVQGPVSTRTFHRKAGGEGSKQVIIARQFGLLRTKAAA